ncbi:hypothetical protein KIK84_00010 [Curvibacter sp. CHRR-16]|nr:hypothetical protein [Curvibacter sp. CHRR-16]
MGLDSKLNCYSNPGGRRGDQAAAARLLGITRAQLRYRLQRQGAAGLN